MAHHASGSIGPSTRNSVHDFPQEEVVGPDSSFYKISSISRGAHAAEAITPPQRPRKLSDRAVHDTSPLGTVHRMDIIDDSPYAELSPGSQPNDSTGLLPSLPITTFDNCDRKRKSRDTASPPFPPPYVSSAQFSSPLRQQPSSSFPSHPWNTPGPSVAGSSLSPSAPRRLDPGHDVAFAPGSPVVPQSSVSRHRPPVSPTGSPRPLAAHQPQPVFTSAAGEAFRSSSAGWHRQSFTRGGRSSSASSDEREAADALPGLVLVPPQESEEEFMRNVQRIVESDDDADTHGSTAEERTPSPFAPGTSTPPLPLPFPPCESPRSVNALTRLAHHNSMLSFSFGERVPGGELARLKAEREEAARRKQIEVELQRPEYLMRLAPNEDTPIFDSSSTSPSQGTRRRPETRPARLREDKSRRASHKKTTSDTATFVRPARTTRARNAREMEDAIAAVEALEKSHSGIGKHAPLSFAKGKEKEKEGAKRPHSKPPHNRSRSRERSSAKGRAQGDPRPSTPVSKGKGKAVQEYHRPTTPNMLSAGPRNTTVVHGTGVGIAVSPVKGRRLKLLRPNTPPEVTLPSSPAPPHLFSGEVQKWLGTPSTPQSQPTRMKTHAIAVPTKDSVNWGVVDLAALGILVDEPQPPTAAVDLELAGRIRDPERESKKRKRLQAFMDDIPDSPVLLTTAESSSCSRQSPLKPAHVEGLGRMAIHPGDLQGARVVSLAAVETRSAAWRSKTLFGMDVREDDDSLMSGVSTGGAGLRDLWSGNPAGGASNEIPRHPMPDVAFTASLPDIPQNGVVSAYWPDSRFPWVLNEAERKRRKTEKQMERLALVESFLSRESDSESDGTEGDNLTGLEGEEDMVAAGARGLWGLAQDGPVPKTRFEHHRSLFPGQEGSIDMSLSLFDVSPSPVAPSDPADARIALASRRDVRSSLYLAARRREVEAEEEEGQVDCVCEGSDDGRAMVRCDVCRTWSHQDCADINDENDLGECWYCPQCATIVTDAPTNITAPTLVQVDDATDPHATPEDQRVVFFRPLSTSETVSPSLLPGLDPPNSWPFAAPPNTPKSRDARNGSAPGHPLTPRRWSENLQRTPRFFDDYQHDANSRAMDPTSTPSRGTKYGMAYVGMDATPKVPRRLMHEVMFATPVSSSHSRPPGSSTFPSVTFPGSSTSTLKDHSGLSSPPSQHYSMSRQYTDTPIQRSKAVSNCPVPAFSIDSPVAQGRKAAS